MTHALDPGLLLEAVGGLLYVLLGLWVLTLAPRRRQTMLVGAYAIAFGLTWSPSSTLEILHVVEPASALWFASWEPFSLAAWVLALGLALSVPKPLEDRRVLVPALAFGVGLSAVNAWILLGTVPLEGMALGAFTASRFVNLSAGYAAVVLLPLRARPEADLPPGELTQVALLTVAFGTLSAFAGMDLPEVARHLARGAPVQAAGSSLDIVLWGVVVGLWARNMVRSRGSRVRIHRAALLGVLAIMAAGAIYRAAVAGADPGIVVGVTSAFGVGLLIYGILRHDLAGLDAKVEWTVSKTTVAGVFVAVFFVVSEGAQVVFAGFANSELLGIVAAGALLFALAPIQRAADRIAAKAVPSAPADEGSSPRAERTYRRMLRKFLSDEDLSRDEEKALADLAGELGIDPGRAFDLREQVEDEMSGGDAA